MKKNKNIGFIGAGNIATSLIAGLIKQKVNRKNIFSSSPDQADLDNLSKLYSVNVTSDNKKVISSCSVIVLAVKPQVVKKILYEIKEALSLENSLLISVAAGIKINLLESLTTKNQKIVRVMPNTPVSIGKGVSALCCNSSVSVENREEAERIFNSVGSTYWIQENSFDLYTALIGSGPAYIFYLLESLRKAAKELNVEQSKIEKLILEMVIGSAKLARDSAEDPESLRKKVTSPGGVTEKAIEVLEDNKFSEVLIKAIKAGEKRSFDLGEKEDD